MSSKSILKSWPENDQEYGTGDSVWDIVETFDAELSARFLLTFGFLIILVLELVWGALVWNKNNQLQHN